MGKVTSGSYRFRRGDHVGAADAENDADFLTSCFVDNGDLETLLNVNKPHCIVVGRTGSGKTALLLEAERKASGSTKRIAPEALSLNYIANSDHVHYLSSLGVSLDPFFKLLWRQIIAIEILQFVCPVAEPEKQEGILAWIVKTLRDDKTSQTKAARHRRVVDFIARNGGAEFWADTSHRIKDMVLKFEEEIQTSTGRKADLSAGVSHGPMKASAAIGDQRNDSDRQKVIEEVSLEERHRFQNVVNTKQLQELEGILDLVSEVMEDSGRTVYVLIDKLDTAWVDEAIRFRLIRALIDTAISFTRVSRVKVLLAMRLDLLERVYRDAKREPGTQMEKVRDHCWYVFWDDRSLTRVLDERVRKLVSDAYAPNYKVTHNDIMNPKIRKGRRHAKETLDFILERTWKRPRDLIEFFNASITRSVGKPKISDEALLAAEGEYSRKRMRSLSEEWQLEYPYLEETLHIVLRGKQWRFRLSEVSDDEIIKWTEAILAQPIQNGDRLRPLAGEVDEYAISFDQCRVELAAILYKVGAVGIQTDESEKAQWASNLSYSLSPSEIRQSAHLYIHAGLHKALGVDQT